MAQTLDLHASISPDYIEQGFQGHLHVLDAGSILALLACVDLSGSQLHQGVEVLQQRAGDACSTQQVIGQLSYLGIGTNEVQQGSGKPLGILKDKVRLLIVYSDIYLTNHQLLFQYIELKV